MKINLDFSHLYSDALKEWPKELDVTILQNAASDLNRYSVKDLGVISEQIEEKHIGTDHEVILRELHASIFFVIHLCAKSIKKIDLAYIREEAVQVVFEKRLKSASERIDLNWGQKDYELVKAYFDNSNSKFSSN